MSFEYPAGLWSLLGIGVLIAVTLIRRRYDMTPVSSTYLWRLSERFGRQNRAAQRIKKALVFALEMVCLLLAGLLIAQPILVLPGADTHYVAILDGSGSMHIADGQGKTRFERACETILSDVEDLPWGSRVSVIVAGDRAQIAAQALSDEGEVRKALENAACGFGEGDVTGALAICQQLMDEGDASEARLYTDKDYPRAEGVAVANVCGEGEWNVSVLSLSDRGSIHGTAFDAEILSSGRGAEVTFDLYVDGQPAQGVELSVDGTAIAGDTVFCPEGETVRVSLLVRQAYRFSSAQLIVGAQDGLTQDNEYRLYSKPEKTTRVLLAGNKTYFLEKALSVFGAVDLTCEETPTQREGYDLYVYDGCLPDRLPQDGAVWMIHPARAHKETDVVLGEEIMGTYITAAQTGRDGEFSALTKHLSLNEAAVVRFREVKSCGSFVPVLQCGSMPVLLAGRSQGGHVQLILPFDLQDSNLPLLSDYIVLLDNMLACSVPPMLPAQDFACGEVVYPQRMAQCERLFLQTPDMSIRTLDAGVAEAGLMLDAPGGYTLLQELAGGEERMLGFFAHMPQRESRVEQAQAENAIALYAREDDEPQETRMDAQDDQRVKPLRALAAILMMLMLVEWVVYHREKY